MQNESEKSTPSIKRWEGLCIGITRAKGSLGKALTKNLRGQGALIIGLTHGSIPQNQPSLQEPQKWVRWQCGEEDSLHKTLRELDVLILNHGINPQARQKPADLYQAIEVNALSTWRLIELFEKVSNDCPEGIRPKEIWVNTSEAEIQPALSPGYEISKRLIGQLVSLRWNNQTKDQRKFLKIRKLVLGPFRSELNPIGLMSADFVAGQIINQINLGLNLIIVTPNPLTYVLMPATEFLRKVYTKLILNFSSIS